MDALFYLKGSWQGKGKGQYPTIEPFEYEEIIHFEPNASYPLVHYEQKTVLLQTGKPVIGNLVLSEYLKTGLLKFQLRRIAEE